MTDEKRKTAGEINAELLIKSVDDTHCAVDQTEESLKKYEDDFLAAIADGRAKFNSDFYITAIFKREKLLTRITRYVFIVRRSCPTPHFDESVYKYTYKNDRVQYLWTMPDLETANYLINNYLKLDSVERQLADFVLKYLNNELLYTAMKLNNEFPENQILKDFIPSVL